MKSVRNSCYWVINTGLLLVALSLVASPALVAQTANQPLWYASPGDVSVIGYGKTDHEARDAAKQQLPEVIAEWGGYNIQSGPAPKEKGGYFCQIMYKEKDRERLEDEAHGRVEH